MVGIIRSPWSWIQRWIFWQCWGEMMYILMTFVPQIHCVQLELMLTCLSAVETFAAQWRSVKIFDVKKSSSTNSEHSSRRKLVILLVLGAFCIGLRIQFLYSSTWPVRSTEWGGAAKIRLCQLEDPPNWTWPAHIPFQGPSVVWKWIGKQGHGYCSHASKLRPDQSPSLPLCDINIAVQFTSSRALLYFAQDCEPSRVPSSISIACNSIVLGCNWLPKCSKHGVGGPLLAVDHLVTLGYSWHGSTAREERILLDSWNSLLKQQLTTCLSTEKLDYSLGRVKVVSQISFLGRLIRPGFRKQTIQLSWLPAFSPSEKGANLLIRLFSYRIKKNPPLLS